MLKPMLEKIYTTQFGGVPEIRLDWSNDRHHAVAINHPFGPDEIADALRTLAMLVYNDEVLHDGT